MQQVTNINNILVFTQVFCRCADFRCIQAMSRHTWLISCKTSIALLSLWVALAGIKAFLRVMLVYLQWRDWRVNNQLTVKLFTTIHAKCFDQMSQCGSVFSYSPLLGYESVV